jgi:hypothetical protein
MGARDTAETAAGKFSAARSNPYVQRVIEDDELRDNVLAAFGAAKSAYNRVNSAKAPTPKALMDDKKLHRDLKAAADSLKSAGDSLRAAPQAKARRGGGRKILLVLVAGGLALALSGGLRTKVLDALFGKEEEFDYSSTTTPSAAPDPAPTATA